MIKSVISIDLETTGLDSSKHGIIQIGAWATGLTEDHQKSFFYINVNPHYRTVNVRKAVVLDAKALACNKFTAEEIELGEPRHSALHMFHAWLQTFHENECESIIVGHNTPFDVAWLTRVFRENGLSVDMFRRTIDNVALGYAVYGELMSQRELGARLNMQNSDAHDALSDAVFASKIFHRLSRYLKSKSPQLWEPGKADSELFAN